MVLGAVLLPATAFVDMAVHAGDRVGAPVLEELTLTAALSLLRDGTVELQVKVARPDAHGRRALVFHARQHTPGYDGPWTRHASGTLAPQELPEPTAAPGPWPPEGAVPLPLDPGTGEDFYDRLARTGLRYGPAFQGLRAAWRLGDDILAEVSLPAGEHSDAGRFTLHPALLDSALHTLMLAGAAPDDSGVSLPFAWSGVRLHASGARRLRVRVSPTADNGARLELADGSGTPVATLASLVLRPLPREQLNAVRPQDDCLFRLDWTPLPAPTASSTAPATSGLLGEPGPRLRETLLRSDVRPTAYPDVASAGADAPAVVIASPPRTAPPDGRCGSSRTGWPTNDWPNPDWSSSLRAPSSQGRRRTTARRRATTPSSARRCGACSARRRQRTPAVSHWSTPTTAPHPREPWHGPWRARNRRRPCGTESRTYPSWYRHPGRRRTKARAGWTPTGPP
ncbi:polyketide synthase dehydratase domain-containing protein [Streptomyces sp. ITFR-6]|nr:polyketide synthase dehydratase domain-containing protein [Streptomyces sp. ITFR-6]WNI27396.1 polyketide synthase dehydratase domain-containing protein [Streptomyces sp. ITFR-6]